MVWFSQPNEDYESTVAGVDGDPSEDIRVLPDFEWSLVGYTPDFDCRGSVGPGKYISARR